MTDAEERCPICGGNTTFGYGFAGGGLGGYTICLADCGIISKHRTDEGQCLHGVMLPPPADEWEEETE
jgi:hypothetical protein